MSCFHFQSRLSEFLDETLDKHHRVKIESHLKNCKNCEERLSHYESILRSLKSLPKTNVPPQLKKSLKKYSLPRIQLIWMNLGKWEKLPWYVRTFLEGVAIVGLVLIGISSAPKIRTLYEKSVEHSLKDYRDDSLNHHTAENEGLPPLETASHSQSDSRASEDEIAGEADSTPNDTSRHSAQLWRFTLKTVSPDELRPQVVKVLSQLKISPEGRGQGGLQVPGGIEFDLIVSESIVSELRTALHKLVARPEEQIDQTDSSEENSSSNEHEKQNSKSDHFSWYRVHSKQKLPEGKSKVIIWLAQPNG